MTPLSAAYVRMAPWHAPSSPALCTSPGTLGAIAQFHAGMAPGQGHASARPRRAVLPVPTRSSQRAARCHRVHVTCEAWLHMNNEAFRWWCSSVIRPCSLCLAVSLAGCFLSEWSTWSECSATCGGGLSTRNKTILREQEPGGTPCIGPLRQTSVCNTRSCLPGNTHLLFIFAEFKIKF